MRKRKVRQPPPLNRLTYSLDEASALTGIGRTTLRAAIKQSELKARRRGRQVLIRREDLQAYIDQLPMVT
jgi:excisionase family DNA binding protein